MEEENCSRLTFCARLQQFKVVEGAKSAWKAKKDSGWRVTRYGMNLVELCVERAVLPIAASLGSRFPSVSGESCNIIFLVT